MAKYLSVFEVAEFAARLAAHIGMKAPSAEEMCVGMMKRDAFPQVISDGHAQLWVDKLYIAHSTVDEPDVHYAYLTDRHIAEEHQSYQSVRKLRKNKVSLPNSIKLQFRHALETMRATEKNYVIFSRYREVQ